MNGWKKTFIDNTIENGSDLLVQNKQASWSMGRLKNIKCVELIHDDYHIVIEGFGIFWQSDDYEVSLLENKSTLKVRRVQKQINILDRFFVYNRLDNIYHYRLLQKTHDTTYTDAFRITDAHLNKWFTIELNIETKEVIFSYQEDRI